MTQTVKDTGEALIHGQTRGSASRVISVQPSAPHVPTPGSRQNTVKGEPRVEGSSGRSLERRVEPFEEPRVQGRINTFLSAPD